MESPMRSRSLALVLAVVASLVAACSQSHGGSSDVPLPAAAGRIPVGKRVAVPTRQSLTASRLRSKAASAEPTCPTGTVTCGYPGDTIVIYDTNPYNGGQPLYLIVQTPLPPDSTETIVPNPTNGMAPNAQTQSIVTSTDTPVGVYTSSVVWAFDEAGASESIPVSVNFAICDPQTGVCPTPTAAPASPSPTPSASPTPQPAPSDFFDESIDPATSACSSSGTDCVIQGHVLSNSFNNVSCSPLYPEICASITSTYTIGAVPSGIVFTISPLVAVSNTQETFDEGAVASASPGAYGPISVTNAVTNAGGGSLGTYSASRTVQVLCSVRLGTCLNTPAPNATYQCLSTPPPILAEGVSISAVARRASPNGQSRRSIAAAATSGTQVIMIEPLANGSCSPPPATLGATAAYDPSLTKGNPDFAASAAPQVVFNDTNPPTSMAAAARASVATAAVQRLEPEASGSKYLGPPLSAPLSTVVSTVGALDLDVHEHAGPVCALGVYVFPADASQTGSPYNRNYYQVQGLCANGGGLVAGSIRTLWEGTAYNAPHNQTFREVAETCVEGTPYVTMDPEAPLAFPCVGPIKSVVLASGHAEQTSVSVAGTITPGNTSISTPTDYGPLLEPIKYNNQRVPYPINTVDPSWGTTILAQGVPVVPFASPSPTPAPNGLHYCRKVTTEAANGPNCYNDPSAPRLLRAALGNPPVVAGTAFEAHHIQPSSWGGTSAKWNGIYLPEAVHQNYSTWWLPANFTP